MKKNLGDKFMPFIVDDCPRCGASKITFDVPACKLVKISERYRLPSLREYEIYCVCKSCNRGSIFRTTQTEDATNKELGQFKWDGLWDVRNFSNVGSPITPADLQASTPPDYLPNDLREMFVEGAKCMAINCFNAAGTMYRLCLDYATKELLPEGSDEPNTKIRRSLGLRIEWLISRGLLSDSLKELAECVKDDGNDGAHDGTLDKDSALDLEDFTYIILERLYTEKQRVIDAKNRRQLRRNERG